MIHALQFARLSLTAEMPPPSDSNAGNAGQRTCRRLKHEQILLHSRDRRVVSVFGEVAIVEVVGIFGEIAIVEEDQKAKDFFVDGSLLSSSQAAM